ncbi:MAG: hypothetical protein WEA99_03835 [Brumimicrobium sp.]
MPYIKIYYVLLIFLAIVSCRKDKVPELEEVIPIGSGGDYCPEMYEQKTKAYADSFHKVNNMPTCIVGPEYLCLEEYTYTDPILNPNNSFEFAFIRTNPNEMNWNDELCVYNFCTNEMNILTDQVGYDIDWGAKDWILFTGKDLQLYKIKSNGDSLIQLTDTGTWNDKAKWNPDGTKYLYLDANANTYKICDEENTILKEFVISMAEFDWLNDEKIIFSRSSGTELSIKEYDLETESEVLLYSQAHEGSGEPLSIHEEKIYFTSETGVHVYENGSETLLDSSYFTYTTSYPQYLAPNKILLQRYITDTTDYPCTVHYMTYISILDLSDNTEEYIEIPE